MTDQGRADPGQLRLVREPDVGGPCLLQNFRGTLDENGNNGNPITVSIPPGLPCLSGRAIFGADGIYRGSSNSEVTNTHRFVLPCSEPNCPTKAVRIGGYVSPMSPEPPHPFA
ncbi:MAG: hypothetical protein JXQ29_03695 [Planctomycetes bacterium]|nr:hypothetical protein [Planctomycetota bacterium]